MFFRIAGKQETRETASFSLARQESDTQGREWVGVVLMRKEKQTYSLGLCGKKVGPGGPYGLEKLQLLTLINDSVEKINEEPLTPE